MNQRYASRFSRLKSTSTSLICFQFPNWHEEPIDFRFPDVSTSDSGTQVPSTPVPEYSSIVKSGLLFTVSSASSWRQRVNVRVFFLRVCRTVVEELLHSASVAASTACCTKCAVFAVEGQRDRVQTFLSLDIRPSYFCIIFFLGSLGCFVKSWPVPFVHINIVLLLDSN